MSDQFMARAAEGVDPSPQGLTAFCGGLGSHERCSGGYIAHGGADDGLWIVCPCECHEDDSADYAAPV